MQAYSTKDSKKYLDILLIIAAILLIDQLTKYLATTYLQPRQMIPVLGDFLRLTYVENTGMAFGIDINNRFLFNLLSLTAIGIIFFYLFHMRHHEKMRLSLAIILGGAFGNLIDRFFHGRVVDFLDLDFFDVTVPGMSFLVWELPALPFYRWPVFNIADMAVSTGMLIILFTTLFQSPPQTALENVSNK